MKIDKISSKEFSEYWLWRKTNFNRKSPSNGTLKREKTCLVPLFKFAKSKGYISDLPDFSTPAVKPERRPTFTPKEWKRITRMAREWIKDGHTKGSWRDRFVAWQYFLILANSGLRVGEARRLKWSDLRTVSTEDGTRIIAEVYGKTGHREVVFQTGANEYVKRLYDLRLSELGEAPKLSEHLFVHPNGDVIKSMKRALVSLLEFVGIPVERHGKNRTIYSLRHFYATQRLSNEVSPFILAKQMGTSVEMLEKHYGHIVTSTLAATLTKGPQRATISSETKYPFE
nr:site-specific integrase [Aliiroseovarius sp. PrR006]